MAGSPSLVAVGKGSRIPSILQQNAAASGRNRGCTDLKVDLLSGFLQIVLDANFLPRLVKVVQDFAPGSPWPSVSGYFCSLICLVNLVCTCMHKGTKVMKTNLLRELTYTFQHSKVLEIRKKRWPPDMGLHADLSAAWSSTFFNSLPGRFRGLLFGTGAG